MNRIFASLLFCVATLGCADSARMDALEQQNAALSVQVKGLSSSQTGQVQALEARLAALEALREQVPDKLRTRRLEVIDATGQVAASLGMLKVGTVEGINLSMHDAKGDKRASLWVSSDTAQLSLRGPGAGHGVTLHAKSNAASCRVYGADNASAAELRAVGQSTRMSMRDAGGKTWSAGPDAPGK